MMPETTNSGFCCREDVAEFRGFLAQVNQFPCLKLLLVVFGPDVVIGGLVFE